MSQAATDLCALLVEDSFGTLASRVFKTLTTDSRLTFPALHQRSQLTASELWHVLAALVQARLVLWFEDPSSESTFYQANIEGAYKLVRSGRHVRAVEERLGKEAALVLQSILTTGPTTLQDLVQVYQSSLAAAQPAARTSTITNGTSSAQKSGGVGDTAARSFESVSDALCKLLKERHLLVVHDSHFHPDDDNETLAEMEAADNSNLTFPLKPSEKPGFYQHVDRLRAQWKDGGNYTEAITKIQTLYTSSKAEKRPLDEGDSDIDTAPKKRRRLVNGAHKTAAKIASIDPPPISPDRDLVLRVNEDKVAVTARTQALVQLCEDSIGAATAHVYGKVLRILEADIRICGGIDRRPDIDDAEGEDFLARQVSTDEIVAAITDFDWLEASIGEADVDEEAERKLRRRLGPQRRPTDPEAQEAARRKQRRKGLDDQTSESASSSDDDGADVTDDPGANGFASGDDANATSDAGLGGDKRESSAKKRTPEEIKAQFHHTHIVRQHLLLLADQPRGAASFLHLHAAGGSSSRPEAWSVPLRGLAARLRVARVAACLGARHGPLGARAARMLADLGKLDEKALAARALAPPKTLRALLGRMHAAGHVELQEVPRDAQRAPSRTVFLWGFDPERCGRRVLDDALRAMARCLARLKVERATRRGVLEKSQRSDVVGREAEMLSARELADLAEWRGVEEKLWGEVMRLDDIVMALRDF